MKLHSREIITEFQEFFKESTYIDDYFDHSEETILNGFSSASIDHSNSSSMFIILNCFPCLPFDWLRIKPSTST